MQADLGYPVRPDLPKVDPHEERDRNGQENGIGAPGIVPEGVHYRKPETGEGDQDDEDDRDCRGKPTHRTDLIAGDLRKRPAIPPHRGGEDHHIVHGARQGGADEDP